MNQISDFLELNLFFQIFILWFFWDDDTKKWVEFSLGRKKGEW